MIRAATLPLLLAMGLIACGSTSAQKVQSSALGAEVTLAPGQAARVGDHDIGIEVQFIAVTEDSRCPRDTTCVWPGEAKVLLSIRSGARPSAQHTVLEGASIALDGYSVTVVRVQPEPISTRKILPEEYRVTLTLARVAAGAAPAAH